MTNEARAARNAYKRAWNAANKEKTKAYQERYWEKKAVDRASQSPADGTENEDENDSSPQESRPEIVDESAGATTDDGVLTAEPSAPDNRG